MNLPKRPFIECGHIFTAHFLGRPNRFLIRCESDELGEIEAHLPNPGRLWELLLPKAKLYLQKAIGKGRGGDSVRKTKYTVLAVERDGHPIFLQTHADTVRHKLEEFDRHRDHTRHSFARQV